MNLTVAAFSNHFLLTPAALLFDSLTVLHVSNLSIELKVVFLVKES